MGKLSKIAAGILISLVLLAVLLRITGFEPHDRLPGLWVKGNLVTTPVTDWSFTDKYPNIFVETHPWYLIAHSVTTTCVAHEGRLYLTSTYDAGLQFPRDRAWNRYVMRDPHVRLKIGDQIYEQTLTVVTDPAEKEAVQQTKAKKYPSMKIPEGGTVHVFRVS